MTTNLNLATEINIVKGAIASSNNKVTSLLNTVHYLQNQFLVIDNSFSQYVINIDSSINYIKQEFETFVTNFDGSFVSDLSFQNIQSQLENFDASLNYLYQNLSNSFVSEASFNALAIQFQDLSGLLDVSFISEASFNALEAQVQQLSSDVSFLSDFSFQQLQDSINLINDLSFVSEASFNYLETQVQELSELLDASFVSEASFNELVLQVQDLSGLVDASFVSEASFNEFKQQLNNIVDASFVSEASFNEFVELSFNKLLTSYLDASLDSLNVNNLDISQNLNVNGEVSILGETNIFNNLTVSGELRGPSLFVIDPNTWGDNKGVVRIKGDLIVDGSQTIINSSVVDISDINLTLGKGASNIIELDGAGLDISGSVAQLYYNYDNSGGKWQTNIPLSVSGDLLVNGYSFNNLKDQLDQLDSSFVTDISFQQLSNNTENNINFLTNQNTLVKNDVTFNYSLIDNNSLLVNELQSKIANLLTLINNNLGTSYTYNDI